MSDMPRKLKKRSVFGLKFFDFSVKLNAVVSTGVTGKLPNA